MAVLTDDQRAQYEKDGYLLASGLIPEDVSERAEAAMWNLMGMDPDDPSTWSQRPEGVDEFKPEGGLSVFNGVQDPDIMACATPAFLKANAELLGEEEPMHAPEAVHTQNKVPLDGEWTMRNAHIDGIPKQHMHRTWPGPYRIASLLFLNDVEQRGGGTAIWPGSHRKIWALAESDREKYEHLFYLNKDIRTLDLGDPIELTPKRGDVLFFTYMFGHNGTSNVGSRPRWMMRFGCSCDICSKWPKTKDWHLWSP